MKKILVFCSVFFILSVVLLVSGIEPPQFGYEIAAAQQTPYPGSTDSPPVPTPGNGLAIQQYTMQSTEFVVIHNQSGSTVCRDLSGLLYCDAQADGVVLDVFDGQLLVLRYGDTLLVCTPSQCVRMDY